MKLKKVIPLLLVASIALTSCGKKKEEVVEEETFTAVKVTEVQPTSIEKTLVYTGKIEPVETVSVISKLSGTVTSTNKNVGDSVTQGETLFTIDQKDIKNAIDQASAQANSASLAVKSAQNSYNNITGTQFDQSLLQLEGTIETLENSLKQAQDSLDLATTTYNNAKALFNAGAMSKVEYDQAELAYNNAKIAVDNTKAQLKQTQESYDLTKNNLVSESKASAQIGISQAQASAQSAQLALDIAEQNLTDTSPKSPISGVVSQKGATAGQMISAGTQAYTVTNIDEVTATVKVSENIINTLSIGGSVQVNINALNKTYTGVISEINPIADQTSTYPVKIKLQNADHEIKPGMFCEISFITESADNVIVLNREVVLRNMDEFYVYVVQDNKAVVRDVTTGIDNGDKIEILSGLKKGDIVITEGYTYVTDGEQINIVE